MSDPHKMSLAKKIKLAALWIGKHTGCFALTRYLTRKGIVILGWHGVSMEDEHTRFPEFYLPPAVLAERIRFLKKHFKIISLDDAVRMHASGNIEPGCAVLTFDDGQYNFLSSAVPEMEKEKVPATVFVLSSTFGGSLSRNLGVRDIFLRAQQAKGQSSTTVLPEHQAAFARHKEVFQNAAVDDLPDCLRQLGSELDVDVEPILKTRMWNFLSREDLKHLQDNGFGVQVHSDTHKTVIEHPEAVYDETRICCERIEEITQTDAKDYCYPSGLWDHDAWVDLEKAGMRSAVTCKVGPNFASTPRLALRRYIDHSQKSQLEFESLVSGFDWLIKVAFQPKCFFEPSVARTPNSSPI